MVDRSRGENHPNAKLTDEDVEQIRELMDWKKQEIERLNSIASCAALAEKFGVSKRCIENISTYKSRAAKSDDLVYIKVKTEQTKKNISSAKIAKDNSAAGEFSRKAGVAAIDVMRNLADDFTATEVAKHIGWSSVTSMRSWMKLRGYELEFKKHKPVPPRRNGWGSIDLSRKARAQSPAIHESARP